MKNVGVLFGVLPFVLLLFGGLSPYDLGAQTCDCQEYIYLNEPAIGSVLKFEVGTTFPLTEVVGANGGTPPAQHWFPGTIPPPSELPSPHGIASDLNGNLYIGDVGVNSNIRKLTCDGVLLDTTADPTITVTGTNQPNQNIFSIDNTLYVNTDEGPTAYDLCTGNTIGQVCLNNAPTGGSGRTSNLWGLSYNPTTEMVYVTRRLFTSYVWAFTRAELEASVAAPAGTMCIDPIIEESATVDVDNIAVGDQFLPAHPTAYMGIVGDNAGNFYVVQSSIDADQGAGQNRILKYDATGAFQAASIQGSNANDGDPLNNFQITAGITWSEATNYLFIANLTDVSTVDCITAFDAATMTSLGTAVPNPNLPGNNGAKAIGILSECCPTNIPTPFEVNVCGDVGTTYFLNEEAFANCDGVVCGSSWTPVTLNGADFEPCNNSVTITGTGCSEFTLNLSAVTSTNCPAQNATFTLCSEASPVATPGTTAGTCTGSTPNNDAQINLTAITGDIVGISSAGAAFYDGSAYDAAAAAADLLQVPASGAVDFTGLMPNTTYFVQVFNGQDGRDCTQAYEVMTPTTNCPPATAPASVCNCTDYLYVNDVDFNVTHKFAIDPLTGAVTEVLATDGSVWLDADPDVIFQHGVAQDINGRLYISDGFRNEEMNQISALGEVLDENIFDLDGSNPDIFTTNFIIEGTTLYTWEDDGDVVAIDICTGNKIGEMNVTANYPAGAGAWGFYSGGDGHWYVPVRSDPPAVYRGSLDVSLYTTPATNDGTLVFNPTFPVTGQGGGAQNIMGITRDAAGNFYLIENQTGTGSNGDAVLTKYDPTGTMVLARVNAGPDDSPNTNMTTGEPINGLPGWSGSRGVAYSAAADKIYVGSRNNCVTVFDTDLNELSTLSIGIPSDFSNPADPIIGSPKAINVVTECCPTMETMALSTSVCATPGNPETFSLQSFLACEGIIAEGEWSETADVGNIAELDDCTGTVEIDGTGCATYTLSADGTPAGISQCGMFTINVEICTGTPVATPLTTEPTCDGATQNNDAQINLVGVTGDVVGISSAGAGSYDGSPYDAAATAADLLQVSPTGSVDFTGLMPGTTYFVRVFGNGDVCTQDYEVTTSTTDCTLPPCNVSIDRVSVSDCYFDEAAGMSFAAVELEVSWENPPGPVFNGTLAGPRMDSIEVTLAGQTKFVFQEAVYNDFDPPYDPVGYKQLSSPQLVTFFVPLTGSAQTGLTIAAAFTGDATCADNDATYDLPAECPPDPCVTGPGVIGGNVFEDFNNDGNQDAGEDQGLAGITVTIFVCDANGNSTVAGTTTTDANGDYFFTGLDDAETYRIEFSLPSNLEDSYGPSLGSTNGFTLTQFSQPNTCEINVGLYDPANACPEEEPLILTTCYVKGEITGAGADDPTIVGVPYNTTSFPGAANNENPDNTYYGTHRQTGSVWGVAYDPTRNVVFSSAVLKRHVGLGPLGLGGIYVTDLNVDPTTLPTANFLDLDAGGLGFDFGTEPARDLLSADLTIRSTDGPAFSEVGKVGIGDIDIDLANDDLYLTNVATNELYRIDLANYTGTGTFTGATAGDVASFAIPDPGCSGGEARVWATKVRGGTVYVGLVCDAITSSNQADLRAFIYAFDIATSTFNATPVLEFPLTYPRGSAATNIDVDGGEWLPWEDDIFNFRIEGAFFEIQPQPILSDIEFDVDGSMVIGLLDRASALQLGNNDNYPDGVTADERGVGSGDLLRAAPAGDGFILENNGTVNGVMGAGVGNSQGPGFGEFYDDNFFATNPTLAPGELRLSHAEIGLGGVAIAPGSGQLVTTVVDPNNTVTFSIGIRGLDNTTGEVDFGYTIFRGTQGGNASDFGKGGGLGDLEVLCSVSDRLEIGNYAWIDENENGVQEPCESPLSGIEVKLFRKDGANNPIPIATTETDPNGNYYFSSASALGAGWTATGADTAIIEGEDYFVAFCGDNGYDPATDTLTVDGVLYCVTDTDSGEGANPDLNDSDVSTQTIAGVGDLPAYCTQDGEVEQTNHTFDAGFKVICPFVDLAMSTPPLCSTDSLPLAGVVDSVSGTTAYDYIWSTDGDGTFLDASNNPTTDYNLAVTYAPGPTDITSGGATLSLSSDPATLPAGCDPVSEDLPLPILQVNCGTFPWEGNR
ncbi:MAG: SdrD B-like domain-containing protein [Bacteroidota bacterium]